MGTYKPQPCDLLPITDDRCGLMIAKCFGVIPSKNPAITIKIVAEMVDCGNADDAYPALMAEVQRIVDFVSKEVQE